MGGLCGWRAGRIRACQTGAGGGVMRWAGDTPLQLLLWDYRRSEGGKGSLRPLGELLCAERSVGDEHVIAADRMLGQRHRSRQTFMEYALIVPAGYPRSYGAPKSGSYGSGLCIALFAIGVGRLCRLCLAEPTRLLLGGHEVGPSAFSPATPRIGRGARVVASAAAT
jgi:hypothetical protein